MSNPRITALLVVHDGATWLPEVVASITSQTRSADQILAIDTGSTDASPKLLKGARIPTISLDRTTAFGQALNHAVAQLPPAVDGLEEWLWILHDDCALDPRALEELTSAIADRPNIVMAGPKLRAARRSTRRAARRWGSGALRRTLPTPTLQTGVPASGSWARTPPALHRDRRA
mgnify:CR=1 FL=1